MRDGMKPGAKYYEWEARGVPVRLEIGPRDVSQGQAVLARRTGGKVPARLDVVHESVRAALDMIQRELLETARNRRDQATRRNVTKNDLIEMMEGPGGFAYGGFCGNERCEMEIKERTKATIRVLPDAEFRTNPAPQTCAWCGETATGEAVWAKAY
jgi:prolyl-tRNA synthetase